MLGESSQNVLCHSRLGVLVQIIEIRVQQSLLAVHSLGRIINQHFLQKRENYHYTGSQAFLMDAQYLVYQDVGISNSLLLTKNTVNIKWDHIVIQMLLTVWTNT